MSNLTSQTFQITKQLRNSKNKHNSFVVWFTGLSGSGKSTLANALDQLLFEKNIHTYVLDGDNIRLGINNNLGFTETDRTENIRRVAEIAKLMVDAGIIVITSFISPFAADREMARSIIGQANFVEIFVDCPLNICEQRDVKGLYAKARKGEIKNFTGIDSAFDIPLSPDLIVDTNKVSVEECIDLVLKKIEPKLAI